MMMGRNKKNIVENQVSGIYHWDVVEVGDIIVYISSNK